jgi:excisionase family DNA binding protein
MTAAVCFLSPRDLGHAIGVSESTVKRWVDDGRLRVMRTPGGHRRIPVGETIRFIREQGCDIVRPELLGIEPAVVEARSSAEEIAGPLRAALEAGEESQARHLVVGAFLAGARIAALGDVAIRPALSRIGELWRHGDEGIAIEHHAVQMVAGILDRLRSLIPLPGPDAPSALGGAPSGDPYLLPSQLAALVLAEQGWRTVNLGPDTPCAAFLAALGRHRPKLAWISVCAPPGPGLAEDLQRIAHLARRTGTRLVIGGRNAAAAGPYPGWVRVEGMTDLAAVATLDGTPP